MLRTILRAMLIALIGAVFGLLHNAVSEHHIPYFAPAKVAPLPSDYIPVDEAGQFWLASGGFFLDARAPADYAAGHITGAYNLPVEAFDDRYPKVANMLTLETRLVVYCDGLKCDLSRDLTIRLRQLGYKNIRILQNGWTEWRAAGFSTSSGNQP